MLPCVCSVVDHRRRQNVVRASVTHSAIASCTTYLFLPHVDVICDLLLHRGTATWNLFIKYFTRSPLHCHFDAFHSFSGFCPQIGQIPNGRVIDTSAGIDQASMEFRCNENFRLVGRTTLECTDGRWNGKLPFCESKLIVMIVNCTAFIKIFHCTNTLYEHTWLYS